MAGGGILFASVAFFSAQPLIPASPLWGRHPFGSAHGPKPSRRREGCFTFAGFQRLWICTGSTGSASSKPKTLE